jgi:hypothetical protein
MDLLIIFLKGFSLAYLFFYNSWSKSFFKREIFNNEFLKPIESSYFYFTDNGFQYSKLVVKYASILFLVLVVLSLSYKGLLTVLVYSIIDKQNDWSIFWAFFLEYLLYFIYPLLGLLFFIRKMNSLKFFYSIISLILLLPIELIFERFILKLKYDDNLDYLLEEDKNRYIDYFFGLIDCLKYYLIFMVFLVVIVNFIRRKVKQNANS